jgi:stage V sporulation protein D (sporulation-specific penicillin-binding protein)
MVIQMKQWIQKKLTMKRHLFVLFIVFILLFVGLGIKVVSIALEHDAYSQNVYYQYLNKQIDSDEIVTKRGSILDRNGTVLARSQKVYDIIFDPGVLVQKGEELQKYTTEFLANNLDGITADYLNELLLTKPNSHYEVIGQGLEYEQVEVLEDQIESVSVAGVFLNDYYERIYPYDTMASDVIGFMNNSFEGTYGVEEYYNEYLEGRNGRVFGVVSDENYVNQIDVMPENGQNVVLTIDFSIQKYVEEAISNYYLEEDAKSVNVIVMDPNNGEILAMASYPNIDLNNPYDLSQVIDEETLASMTSEEKYEKRYEIWKNFSVTDTYEPGSTYKPFVLATAIEEGCIDPYETYICTGSKVLYNYVIHCWYDQGHGEETAYEALANSCNVAFMEIGEEVGVDLYYTYQHMFGFGSLTNIDTIGEEDCEDVIYKYDEIGPVELATGSFGQGFNITPIQLITAFSSLINGGNLYEPYLMKEIIDEDDNLITMNEPRVIRQVISEETSTDMTEALLKVVNEGTASSAQIEGYEIGGKTGTAEKGERGNETYVVSFIGFAPADNPQVVTLVVIDEPVGENVSSSLAIPVFKDVMEDVLPYKNIFPTIDTLDEES